MENKPDYFHHIEHRKFQSSSKIYIMVISLVITMIFTVVEFVGVYCVEIHSRYSLTHFTC